MDDKASRLPVVRTPQLPANPTTMQALATTAKRGAALVAAGAVARFLITRAARQFLRSAGPALRATPGNREVRVAGPATPEAPALVEEVLYYRRTVRRR
jgi:hypothetical protein